MASAQIPDVPDGEKTESSAPSETQAATTGKGGPLVVVALVLAVAVILFRYQLLYWVLNNFGVVGVLVVVVLAVVVWVGARSGGNTTRSS